MKSWRLGIMAVSLLTLLTVAACGSKPAASPATGSSGGSAGGSAAKPMNLVMGVSDPGGNWYALGTALSEVAARQVPGSKIELFTIGGAVNTVKGVQQDKIDIGISTARTLAEGRAGDPGFDTKQDKVMGLTWVFDTPLHIAVRADSDIKSVADLKGKRVAPGLKNFASVTILRRILTAYGIDLDKDMAKVEYVGFSDGVSLFKDRHVDAFVSTPAAPVMDIASTTPVRMLGVDKDKLDTLLKQNPGYVAYTIKGGTFNGTKEDIVSINDPTILIVDKDVPATDVERLLNAMYTEADYFSQGLGFMRGFVVGKGALGIEAALHPGAQTFFKSKGALK